MSGMAYLSSMTLTRPRTVLLALLCAACAAGALSLLGTAEAKRKGPNIAGKYAGPTEYDGAVSFRLTRGGKVLDFRLTNATLECQIVAPPGTPESPTYERVVTITHGPMSMRKKSRKNPQGKKFDITDSTGYYKGGIVNLTSGPDGGRVLDAVGFNGETSVFADTGPANVPGSERCASKIIDWEAKKPASKGFVAVGNSGHRRPPLSEFSAGLKRARLDSNQ